MARMLTEHFSIDEFLFSQIAARKGIDNTPPPDVLKNLRRLAQTLEEARDALGGAPILISSGYRSPALNKAAGGAKNSAHLSGRAVDFTAPRFGTVLQTARALSKAQIGYDQIIFEFGRWVHLSIPAADSDPRLELLSIFEANKYLPGLVSAA